MTIRPKANLSMGYCNACAGTPAPVNWLSGNPQDIAMADFHIFPLDKSGHITGREDVTCPTAEEAFSYTTRLLKPDMPSAEIWIGRRRLGQVCARWFLDPVGTSSASSGCRWITSSCRVHRPWARHDGP